jgi:hypothetical protein
MPTRLSLADLRRELDDLWSKFDALYAGLDAPAWSRKFGKDWTFADQPFHMSQIDQMVARNVTMGENLPQPEQVLLDSESKLNSWNGALLAKKAAAQTGPQSLEEWKKTRQQLRDIMSKLTEADLARKAWLPIYTGWSDVHGLLGFSLVHATGEYSELLMRLKKRGPLPTARAINFRFDMLMRYMPLIMNKEAAKTASLTSVMTFTGEGGGSWTIDVQNGACTVTDGRPARRDLEMTTSFLGFEKMSRKMANPMLMMLTRQLKISGMRKMGAFGKLFPM